MTNPSNQPGPVAGSIHDLVGQNALQRISLTDTGLGQFFVNKLRDRLRYVPMLKTWMLWNGKSWEPDTVDNLRTFALTQWILEEYRIDVALATDVEDREALLQAIVRYESESKRRAIMNSARADPRIIAEEDEFDAQLNLLVCKNGTVDLRTGEMVPSRPEHLSSRSCAVDYDPKATSPHLDKYLATFLPDPLDQRFIWAVLGYCLYGGNPRRLFVIVHGGTTSGKSQLFAALNKILGRYAFVIGSSVFRGNLDDKPRPDLVKAMFTRLAYAMEASRGWSLHADQIKRLTGGADEPLPFRALYGETVNKVPRFTPCLVTNEMPRITGADAATKRRIIALHFAQSLTKEQEDPAVKAAFLADEDCLKAILAMLIAGARDPIIDEPPAKFMLATMAATSGFDHVDDFLEWAFDEEFLVRDSSIELFTIDFVSTGELHALYRHWVTKYGDSVDHADRLSSKGLNKVLRDREWQTGRSKGTRWLGYRLGEGVPLWLKVEL